MGSSLNGTPVHHHPEYYLEDGNIVFKVEDTLFKVHRYFFMRESIVFRDMLSFPAAADMIAEGTCDENPIFLEQVTSKQFGQLLSIFYDRRNVLYDVIHFHDADHWLGILHLTHRWQFDVLSKFAIKALGNVSMDAISKILICQRYNIDFDWATSAFVAMCTREQPLSTDEGEKLGATTAVLIAHSREILREESTLTLIKDCSSDDDHLFKVANRNAANIIVQTIIIERRPRSALVLGDLSLFSLGGRKSTSTSSGSLPIDSNAKTVEPSDEGTRHLSDNSFPKRHPQFYIDDGNITFLAEGLLFRVHRYFFPKRRRLKKSCLLPLEDDVVGRSDQNPIVLPHVKSDQFAHLLGAIYNPTYEFSAGSTELWISTLNLTTKWNIEYIRETAICSLHRAALDPVEKIRLWKVYRIANYWVEDAFHGICERDEPLSFQEGKIVGLNCAVLIAQARERMRQTNVSQKIGRKIVREVIFPSKELYLIHGLRK